MMMKKIKSVFLISSILILCLFLSSCETKKQKDERDLSKFISIDLQGTENNGFVKIDFDKDDALEKVTKNLKLDEKNNKYELIELNSLFDSVKINPITKTTNLKNSLSVDLFLISPSILGDTPLKDTSIILKISISFA